MYVEYVQLQVLIYPFRICYITNQTTITLVSLNSIILCLLWFAVVVLITFDQLFRALSRLQANIIIKTTFGQASLTSNNRNPEGFLDDHGVCLVGL